MVLSTSNALKLKQHSESLGRRNPEVKLSFVALSLEHSKYEYYHGEILQHCKRRCDVIMELMLVFDHGVTLLAGKPQV